MVKSLYPAAVDREHTSCEPLGAQSIVPSPTRRKRALAPDVSAIQNCGTTRPSLPLTQRFHAIRAPFGDQAGARSSFASFVTRPSRVPASVTIATSPPVPPGKPARMASAVPSDDQLGSRPPPRAVVTQSGVPPTAGIVQTFVTSSNAILSPLGDQDGKYADPART